GHSEPSMRSASIDNTLRREKYLSFDSMGVPGRDVGAGAIHHVADRRLVGLPLFAVAPVLLRDLEALETGLLALLEAVQLLLLRDREPELDHDDVVVREMLLEVVDLGVGAHPVGLAAQPLDALDQHAPVPRAVEDREAAATRDVAPEAPQV